MSFQFHHKDPYGRRAGKGAASSFNAQDIANEAERKPSACRHVKEPKPPTLLFGVMPSDAVKKSYAWAAQAKDKIGRKLRPDALCIVAGVVSVPAGFDQWDAYKKAVIADLLSKHGDRLLSVVEHTDEAYPHLHYYMVPRVGERMEVLHEGLAARNELRDAKKTTGEQNLAYKAAMEKFQTDFHTQVSKPFGLLRDGPKRERLSTPEWRVKQAAAKRGAAMMKETEAKCQAMTLAALEASAGQSAAERVDALTRLKAEMENLRATTAQECELKTKTEMEKARVETQAAAIAKQEARKEKDEAAANTQAAARKLAAANTVTAQAAQKLSEADAVKQAATQTEQEAARLLTEAQGIKGNATTEAEAVKAGAAATAAQTTAQADTEAKQKLAAAYAEIVADRQVYKTNREKFVAAAKTEGLASGTPAAVKALEAKLQKADEQAARNYQLVLKEQQRASVWEQSDKQKGAEIATLKTKLQALTPATQHNNTQGNAPAPRL